MPTAKFFSTAMNIKNKAGYMLLHTSSNTSTPSLCKEMT